MSNVLRMFFLGVLWFQCLSLQDILIYFSVCYESVFQLHRFTCGCPTFPTSPAEETVFFPLYIFGLLCWKTDHRGGGLILGSLFCTTDPCMSVFVLISFHFDCCSFVVLPEVWEGYAFSFVLFPQDCFGNSGSFMVPYKVQDYLFYFYEKCHG